MNLTFLYGASKRPLRIRIADNIERVGDRIWDWGTLSDTRTMTEVDIALMSFCGAIYRLSEVVR